MNKILVLFIILFSFRLSAQDSLRVFNEFISEEDSVIVLLGQYVLEGYEIMNVNGSLYYEIKDTLRNSASLIKPANLVVRVTDLNRNFIKDIIVDYHDLDAGKTQFAASYFGEQNFLILTTKYKFYIIDLDDYKASGPFAPEFKGEGTDATSGMLRDIRLSKDGRYLFMRAKDFGEFYFDLKELK
jgi:hypothetical protein